LKEKQQLKLVEANIKAVRPAAFNSNSQGKPTQRKQSVKEQASRQNVVSSSGGQGQQERQSNSIESQYISPY